MQFRIPFDRIRAGHVEPAVAELLAQARARLNAIAAEPGPRTYRNTMGALDRFTEPLDYAMSVVGHLESVATYPELRAAYNAVQPEVSAFHSGIPLNHGLWQGILTFASTAEGQAATGERRRFLDKTIESFPPPRRRSRCGQEEAAGRDRRRVDAGLYQIRRKRSRFH